MPSAFVNGRTLFYEEEGDGDGNPFVFLSGLGGDHRTFAASMRAFGTRFRTLSIDARDTGQSDRAQAPYSTADMADDVAGWLVQLKLTHAHVLGHSLGGMVAQELAVRHPALVRSLILVSSHCGSDAWRRALLDSWIMLRRMTDAGTFWKMTLPWLAAPPFYRHAGQVEGLIRFAEQNEFPQEPEAFERQAQAASSHNTHNRLGAIAVPTLVVVGELDIMNPPRMAKRLADAIPQSRFEVIPGVGHLPHIEDGPRLRAVVDSFLAG